MGNITIDTNVLVRAVTLDDPIQSKIATNTMAQATKIVIPITVLCEYVWVLARAYKFSAQTIANSIRQFLDCQQIVIERHLAEAGLRLLEEGGDFADGVNEALGNVMGGATFVSFDQQAIKLLEKQKKAVRLL